MAFESKYINPKKKALDIVPNKYGGLTVKIVDTPSYKLMRFGENGDIVGTEILFDGRLFYPVIHLQKGPQGYAVTLPDFMIHDELFFWNKALDREESELDLQGYFKSIGVNDWRKSIESLNEKGFIAVKIALDHFVRFLKKELSVGKDN